jgi:hypothetical protein
MTEQSSREMRAARMQARMARLSDTQLRAVITAYFDQVAGYLASLSPYADDADNAAAIAHNHDMVALTDLMDKHIG